MGDSLLQVHFEVLIYAGPLSEKLERLQQGNSGNASPIDGLTSF